MADEKKTAAAKPAAAKKVTKKVTKTAGKKPAKTTAGKTAKKTTKKAAKKVTRKVTKKATKKVTRKPAAKKAANKTAKKTASRKPAAKKASASKASVKKKSTAAADVRNSVEAGFEHVQAMLQENLSGMNAEKAEVLAKNIWLAGLGAYSRTLNEVSERRDELSEDLKERYESMRVESEKVFDELVARGKEMQGDAEKAMLQGRENLEERVEELKQRLGGGLSSFVDIPGRLRDAAERIEEISARLQKKK